MDLSGKTFLCLMGAAAADGVFLIAHLRRNLKLVGIPIRKINRNGCTSTMLPLGAGNYVWLSGVCRTFRLLEISCCSQSLSVWLCLWGCHFLLGVLEDFTGAVSPRYRLGAAMLALGQRVAS